MSIARGRNIPAALLLAACCHLTPALAEPLPCDDGIKAAFRPDADTSVIAVRLVKKGEELKAPDAPQPVTAAADLCLVKLLVGPDYTGLADAVNKGVALQPALFSDLITDKSDLTKLRELGRKVVVYTGLVDDAIPPAGNINYHERVVAAMGGHAEVQKFMRMYLLPGSAHSSQGRAYTVGGKNDTVPLPKLPGNANQTPAREQDQFFTALVDWVEKDTAPGEILLTSRDNSLSYPVCVYPLRTTWNGNGDAKQASSYSCR